MLGFITGFGICLVFSGIDLKMIHVLISFDVFLCCFYIRYQFQNDLPRSVCYILLCVICTYVFPSTICAITSAVTITILFVITWGSLAISPIPSIITITIFIFPPHHIESEVPRGMNTSVHLTCVHSSLTMTKQRAICVLLYQGLAGVGWGGSLGRLYFDQTRVGDLAWEVGRRGLWVLIWERLDIGLWKGMRARVEVKELWLDRKAGRVLACCERSVGLGTL